MAKPNKRVPNALEGAGEDLKAVPKAGTAGVLLTAMIILALIAAAVLGIMLLFQS